MKCKAIRNSCRVTRYQSQLCKLSFNFSCFCYINVRQPLYHSPLSLSISNFTSRSNLPLLLMSAWTIKFISFQLILLFPILVLVVTFSCLASYIDMPFVMVCEHLHKQENNNTRTYQKKKHICCNLWQKKSGKRNEGKTSKTILCANGITKPKQKPVVMLHTHTLAHANKERYTHTRTHQMQWSSFFHFLLHFLVLSAANLISALCAQDYATHKTTHLPTHFAAMHTHTHAHSRSHIHAQ